MARKTTIDEVDIAALPLIDEPDSRQFVLRVGDHRARMEYERDGDRIFLGTLDVPKPIVELGVGDAVMEKTLLWVEENRLKLIPTAPAIKAYLRKHTAWQRLLLKGVQL